MRERERERERERNSECQVNNKYLRGGTYLHFKCVCVCVCVLVMTYAGHILFVYVSDEKTYLMFTQCLAFL